MVKTGQKVKDLITGLEGIVVVRVEWMHGAPRLDVQPQSKKNGEKIKSFSADECAVKVINKSRGPALDPPHDPTFAFGQKVKDPISGFEGIVTGRSEHITGCRLVCIQGPVIKGQLHEAEWLQEDRVNAVGKLIGMASEEKVTTGGPARSPRLPSMPGH